MSQHACKILNGLSELVLQETETEEYQYNNYVWLCNLHYSFSEVSKSMKVNKNLLPNILIPVKSKMTDTFIPPGLQSESF